MGFHHYLSKINVNEYLKTMESPEFKERLRNTCMRIKSFCEERKYYVKSYIDTYEKVLKEVELKEREAEREEAERNKEKVQRDKEKLHFADSDQEL